MHLLISAAESAPFLKEELSGLSQGSVIGSPADSVILARFPLHAETPPTLVFARQFLPDAEEFHGASIGEWSRHLFTRILAEIPEGQAWRLHLVPHYGEGIAGQNRCRLIRESLVELMRRKRRSLVKTLQDETAPFTAEISHVQLLLMAPDHGFVSVAVAPLPFQLRRIMSPFLKGEIPVASDKAAPSRAFAKLVEAGRRLGQHIQAGQSCVDLGASPGSWSYVALQQGARVTAVDRAPLRADLMHDPKLTFQQGDAFSYDPPNRVDWLLCDVIAAPERSIDLLLRWLREKRCRQFVVTIKFKGAEDYGRLELLKTELPPQCEDFYLTRLCANKNEACAFGIAR